MKIFFLILYLLFGCLFYLVGWYIKKKPYSHITKYPRLLKMATKETAKLYESRLSLLYRMFGLFYAIVAIAQWWACDFFEDTVTAVFLLVFLFASMLVLIICSYVQEKVVTGKVPVKRMALVVMVILITLSPIGILHIEPSVKIDNENIKLSGLYGETVLVTELKDIYTADTLPTINMRTNGISMGDLNKGYFRSKSLGRNIKLILHSRKSPFVYIKTDKKYIILNFRKKEKTEQIYEQLKQLVKHE